MTSFDLPLKQKDKLFFIPLGGSNEIGINFNIYCYNDALLAVDLGLGFPDEDLPGTDVTLPKISAIEPYKDKLLGIVITHAHEDHIGAVAYLAGHLGCPIYATAFTAYVLRAKFAEFGITETGIIVVAPNETIKLGPFLIKMFGLTHSIPDMRALWIGTAAGNVIHTGDWKIDPDPLIGSAIDEVEIQALAKKGVLAMVCDSTNIFHEMESGSEGALAESLGDIISQVHRGLIVVTTFASNIARLYAIAKAAMRAKRRVALSGRALWRLYKAALSVGYMSDVEPFIESRDIKKYKKDELLVICTGCQGERLAAISKMAQNQHLDISIEQGDTIIFSSKIIPGNERKVFALLNIFSRNGVDVLTEKDHFVHVSGHPSRQEVQKMYEWMKPIIAVPVHGEAIHLREHCKFALKCGAKYSVEVSNGDVVELNPDGPGIVGKVESGYLAVDGNYIIDTESPILRERRTMRDNGLVAVMLILSQTGKIIKKPKVSAPGVVDYSRDLELMGMIVDKIYDAVGIVGKKRDGRAVVEAVTKSLNRLLKTERGKMPQIIVQVEYI